MQARYQMPPSETLTFTFNPAPMLAAGEAASSAIHELETEGRCTVDQVEVQDGIIHFRVSEVEAPGRSALIRFDVTTSANQVLKAWVRIDFLNEY